MKIYFRYLLLGAFFGIVAVKSEIISWYRIQEMFHFQSIHMYGIIGTAVAVGALSIFLIKRFHYKTIDGETIKLEGKPLNKGTIIGGLIFGFGWALTGACPGPLYALVGNGLSVGIVMLLSAILGTFVYGLLKEKLPH